MKGSRLPTMLKDAALTVLVAAALGVFIVGFRTVDVGSRTGLGFDYQFTDLGVALVVIFFGRLGLSLVAEGLRWPAVALGIVMIAVGASPLELPSGGRKSTRLNSSHLGSSYAVFWLKRHK